MEDLRTTVGNSCLSTNTLDMKECDAPESKRTSACTEPDAVIVKFLVSSVHALVLFDSGASHSFISRVFVDKHELPTVTLKAPIHISSPGAEMSASMGGYQIDLAIGRHVFPTDLIILKSQGLDVIGMDWLAKYQGCYRLCQSFYHPPYTSWVENQI